MLGVGGGVLVETLFQVLGFGNNLLLLFNLLFEFLGRLAQLRDRIPGPGEHACQVIQLIARLFLIGGCAEQAALLQIPNGRTHRFGQAIALRLRQGLLHALTCFAAGRFNQGRQLADQEHRFIAQRLLFGRLHLQCGALGIAHLRQRLAGDGPGQLHRIPEILVLAGGQVAEPHRDVIHRLLATVFLEQLIELRQDRLLRGIRAGQLMAGGGGIGLGACLAQQIDHALHVFSAEFAQHVVQRLEGKHILSLPQAVAFELGNELGQFAGDGGGLGADLLLVGFGLADEIRLCGRCRNDGAGQAQHDEADSADHGLSLPCGAPGWIARGPAFPYALQG